MPPIQSNKKRIAKNTIALYVRMFVNLVVSLYTSRVVLATLGIEDYGIYGVVGGIVGMFSFLNAAQSGATSRFLTYEMGKGDKQKLKDTFSSALIVHVIIAIAVVILAETIGVWFLENKLVIPEERMHAARWVLQLSIISSIFVIIQVPYNATIIAHEKMDVYAYVEMLHVFLKLGIVYLLMIVDIDKLILYAALVLMVTLLITVIYMLYCIFHYEEVSLRFIWDKGIIKSLLSFSGFNLFGNMGGIFNLQGTNFVVNMFFGVTYNAAVGVATTVSGAIEGFASNVLTAFRPQITKDYAREDYHGFEKYIDMAIKVILIIYCLVAIPAFIEMDKILSLWLKEVPICANIFCRLMLINIFFSTMRHIITVGIHATGRVKTISLWTGTLQMLNPFVIWLLYKAGMPPQYTYVSIIIVNALLSAIDLELLHRYVAQIRIRKLANSCLLVLAVCSASLLLSSYLIHFMDSSISRIFVSILVSAVLTLSMSWFICLEKGQKETIKFYISNKIHRKKRISNYQ